VVTIFLLGHRQTFRAWNEPEKGEYGSDEGKARDRHEKGNKKTVASARLLQANNQRKRDKGPISSLRRPTPHRRVNGELQRSRERAEV